MPVLRRPVEPAANMRHSQFNGTLYSVQRKSRPKAALQYRTMWCRPALFARLFTTDPTDLRSRSGSALTLKRALIEQADRLYYPRRQSTRLLVVHSAGDDPIRVAGASRGRQVRDHAPRTACAE